MIRPPGAAVTVAEPTYLPAMIELGEVEARRGRHEAAVQVLTGAVQRDPANPRAWYGLASSLDELGRLPQALEAYGRFRELWAREDERSRIAEGRIRQLEGRR